MASHTALGSKVRALRRAHRLTQAELARKLGISPSYLNLLEQNKRSLPADLLVRLAAVLPIRLSSLSTSEDVLVADLVEALGDPLFEDSPVAGDAVRDLAMSAPAMAQAFCRLYQAYRGARESVHELAATVDAQRDGPDLPASPGSPAEEVSDLIQRHLNYFPELEAGAEQLRSGMAPGTDALFTDLVSYLRRTRGIEVHVAHASDMRAALRRFDAERGVLYLSEQLRRGSRIFQLAHQIGLLVQRPVLDRVASDPRLTTPESQSLCRVALANYFASAVLMPYDAFLTAAKAERYDIDVLGHRFRATFEQVCQRLTTLRRPRAEGIPFHMLRIDMAGNISKRFSASGLRFPRYNGACPKWTVFEAFQTPGRIRVQVSRFPDGSAFFEIARTVYKQAGGYHGSHCKFAIALGCDLAYAGDIVYADSVNLDKQEAAVLVGPTCRLCDRMNCEQRACPPLQQALTVCENVRGVAFYAPVQP